MDEPTIIYCLSLYRGNRCVGCVRTQSAQEAQERSELWCSYGEGHTTRIDRQEKVESQHQEPIPNSEYLTQRDLNAIHCTMSNEVTFE